MKVKKYVLPFILFMVLVSCTTIRHKKTNKSEWGFDNYLLEAQQSTSKQRYSTAISTLNDLQKKFPDTEKIMVNYLIGFNYYNIKAFGVAKKYLEVVFPLYENLTTESEKLENKKFVTLATIVLDRISKEEAYFDPYHVRDDIEKSKNKKIEPKKD